MHPLAHKSIDEKRSNIVQRYLRCTLKIGELTVGQIYCVDIDVHMSVAENYADNIHCRRTTLNRRTCGTELDLHGRKSDIIVTFVIVRDVDPPRAARMQMFPRLAVIPYRGCRERLQIMGKPPKNWKPFRHRPLAGVSWKSRFRKESETSVSRLAARIMNSILYYATYVILRRTASDESKCIIRSSLRNCDDNILRSVIRVYGQDFRRPLSVSNRETDCAMKFSTTYL